MYDPHYCESSLGAVGLVYRDEELGARRAINPAGGGGWKLDAIVFRKTLPGLRRHLGGTLVGKEALADTTGGPPGRVGPHRLDLIALGAYHEPANPPGAM